MPQIIIYIEGPTGITSKVVSRDTQEEVDRVVAAVAAVNNGKDRQGAAHMSYRTLVLPEPHRVDEPTFSGFGALTKF